MNTMSAVAEKQILEKEIQQQSQQNKVFSFDKSFQEKIVQACLVDRLWASQFSEVLDVNYFQFPYLKLIAFEYFQYHTKYKEFPSFELLLNILKDKLKSDKDSLLREQIKSFLVKVQDNEDLGDLGYVKDKSLDFCKKVGLQKALEQSVDLLETEKYEKIVDLIKNAITAGNSNTPGLDLFSDVDARYSETFRKTVATGVMELDQRKILNGGLGAGELGVVIAPTGCHAKGTLILMHDGSTKKVEDVVVGDRLMGPDSKPRTVLQLARGKEKMYQITPTKGESFVVNENHILSLKRTNDGTSLAGSTINITVKDYITESKTFKHCHKLWRTGVEFERPSPTGISPYVLGLLLGDGWVSEKRIELTTADAEIASEFINEVQKMGNEVSVHTKKDSKAIGYYVIKGEKELGTTGENHVKNALNLLGLIDANSGNKFIPYVYKCAPRKDRLELLAGLIDTDGHRSHNCYEYVSKSKQLAEDVQFITRSLGLVANIANKVVNDEQYWRVTISGNTHIIPSRLSRKQCHDRNQKKNVLLTGFLIQELPEDNFYGFALTDDHLYLTGDFMVHHNTGKSHVLVHLGAQALKQGKNVLYYSYELNERAIGVRFDSHLLEINSTDCYEQREKIKKFYEGNVENIGRLKVKYYPTGSATVNTIRSHVEKLGIQEKFRPDLILIDYAGIMRSTEKYELLRLELKKVYEELRSLANELDVPIWTASQSNKEGADKDVVDLTNMAEAYGQAHVADFILGLSRKSVDKSTGYGNIFVAKNRAGVDGVKYHIHLDTGKSILRVISEDEIRNISTEDEEVSEDSMKFLRRRFKEMQRKNDR